MPLLEYVMDRNNKYRSEYEKDDREKEQNIQYNMTGEIAHVNER